MSKLNITVVPTNLIDFVWPQAETLIKTVVDKAPSDLSIEAIRESIDVGNTLLVTISEGTNIVAVNTVTKETLDSGMGVLFIPITAGTRMDEWLSDFLEIANGLAKAYDCEELRGLSIRKGWMGVLEKHGWVESHVVIKCKVGK